jgi:hypothetical protein
LNRSIPKPLFQPTVEPSKRKPDGQDDESIIKTLRRTPTSSWPPAHTGDFSQAGQSRPSKRKLEEQGDVVDNRLGKKPKLSGRRSALSNEVLGAPAELFSDHNRQQPAFDTFQMSDFLDSQLPTPAMFRSGTPRHEMTNGGAYSLHKVGRNDEPQNHSRHCSATSGVGTIDAGVWSTASSWETGFPLTPRRQCSYPPGAPVWFAPRIPSLGPWGLYPDRPQCATPIDDPTRGAGSVATQRAVGPGTDNGVLAIPELPITVGKPPESEAEIAALVLNGSTCLEWRQKAMMALHPCH